MLLLLIDYVNTFLLLVTCAVAGSARSLLSIFSSTALNSSLVRPSGGTNDTK
jgi:hypothetical protein